GPGRLAAGDCADPRKSSRTPAGGDRRSRADVALRPSRILAPSHGPRRRERGRRLPGPTGLLGNPRPRRETHGGLAGAVPGMERLARRPHALRPRAGASLFAVPVGAEIVMRLRFAFIAALALACAAVPGCRRRETAATSAKGSSLEAEQTRSPEEWLKREPVHLLWDFVRIDTTTDTKGEKA